METEGGYKRTAKSLLLILLSVMVAAEGALAAAQEDRPGRTTFQDVPSNFWAKEAITFAIHNNLIETETVGLFDPYGCVKISDLAYSLYKVAEETGENLIDLGRPIETNSGCLAWAQKVTLLDSLGIGPISVDTSLTREEAIIVLYDNRVNKIYLFAEYGGKTEGLGIHDVGLEREYSGTSISKSILEFKTDIVITETPNSLLCSRSRISLT